MLYDLITKYTDIFIEKNVEAFAMQNRFEQPDPGPRIEKFTRPTIRTRVAKKDPTSSRTSMARPPLEPLKYVRDRNSSR